jgi:hypothetical protein
MRRIGELYVETRSRRPAGVTCLVSQATCDGLVAFAISLESG